MCWPGMRVHAQSWHVVIRISKVLACIGVGIQLVFVKGHQENKHILVEL